MSTMAEMARKIDSLEKQVAFLLGRIADLEARPVDAVSRLILRPDIASQVPCVLGHP